MATGTIDVYVKIPTGRNAQYYVRPSDTIETICKKVAEEEKVKETQVRMKYQGKILNKTHSMSYLGVRPETILKAEVCLFVLLFFVCFGGRGWESPLQLFPIDFCCCLK